ncbi:hypothetical protein ACFOVU_10180 [Nocardiopsis sediminis]|uniref:DUF4145 domain-containing protein n=1 Tax=Nocardiopsis sediminis TaxID=1778267 RepID=A0ABV8FMK3_9ACTN
MDTSVLLGGGAAGAIIGLVTTFMTQFFAGRHQTREFDRADRVRREERQVEEERARDEQKRADYIALNTASRDFLTALTDLLHAVERTESRQEEREALERARGVHRSRYAEAQLRVPDAVLETASSVNRRLMSLFGMVKRLDNGRAHDGDTFETAQPRIQEIWGLLSKLRREMRIDLGVTER